MTLQAAMPNAMHVALCLDQLTDVMHCSVHYGRPGVVTARLLHLCAGLCHVLSRHGMCLPLVGMHGVTY
jgi:hypothetical protein